MASSSDQRDIIWDIDPTMFCTDDQFQVPQVADFPCMSSSSSSSSSNLVPGKPISSTVSTPSSMSSSAVIGGVPDGSGTIDCMDVMENYGYMDLVDGNDFWDPSSLFEQDPPEFTPESEVVEETEINNGGGGGGGERLDELGTMFFDWLKSNKELISAEDMRKIKLKKSTVETASKRLGTSKEGKKQLLKLILEWVQQHQLQRKNSGSGVELHTAVTDGQPTRYPPPFNSGSWVASGGVGSGFSHQLCMPPYPPHYADGNGMAMVAATPFSYMGVGYDSGLNSRLNPYDNTGSSDYQVLNSAPSWNLSQHVTMTASQFPEVGNTYAPQIMPLATGYNDPLPYNPSVYAPGGGDERRLMRLGSLATKEARKKRMARQRRTYFHHHHHSRQNQNNHHNVANSDHHPQAMLVDDNFLGKPHGGNWLYWQSPPSATMVPLPPMEAAHLPSLAPQLSGDLQSIQTSSDELKVHKVQVHLLVFNLKMNKIDI